MGPGPWGAEVAGAEVAGAEVAEVAAEVGDSTGLPARPGWHP